MKLSILMILLALSQIVQSQITFTVNIKSSYNVDIELRRAIYEDTTFVGWWLEKENPTVRMSSTQYRVTLPLNNKYIITFIDPRNDKWKMIYIEPGDVFKANSQFTVTADFNTTDGLSILYNYDTKMFMFRTLER